MAHTQPENVMVNNTKTLLRKMGCKVIKIHGDAFQESGTPDLVGSYRGRCFAIEGKQPGLDAEPIQRVRLKEWQDAGALVGVFHTPEEAWDILTEKTTWKP